MKKYFFTIGIFVFLCLLAWILFPINDQFKDYKKMTYKLNGTNYKLLVADTQEKMTQGLMYVKKLPGYDGMIFIFPDKDYRLFWNKNTLVDLTLYWINDDYVVGMTELPSINKTGTPKTIGSPEPVNKVVELIAK